LNDRGYRDPRVLVQLMKISSKVMELRRY
jgi:hypothetical protein